MKRDHDVLYDAIGTISCLIDRTAKMRVNLHITIYYRFTKFNIICVVIMYGYQFQKYTKPVIKSNRFHINWLWLFWTQLSFTISYALLNSFKLFHTSLLNSSFLLCFLFRLIFI